MATLLGTRADDSRISPHEQRSLQSQTFRELQILCDLSDAEIEKLVASSRLCHVEPHQVVYCAGEHATTRRANERQT